MPHCDGILPNACKWGGTACVSRKGESLYRKPTCFPLGDMPIDTLEVPLEAWACAGARQLQASGVHCAGGVTVMHILKLPLLVDALTGVGFGTGRWAWLAVPTGSTKEGNVGVSGRTVGTDCSQGLLQSHRLAPNRCTRDYPPRASQSCRRGSDSSEGQRCGLPVRGRNRALEAWPGHAAGSPSLHGFSLCPRSQPPSLVAGWPGVWHG